MAAYRKLEVKGRLERGDYFTDIYKRFYRMAFDYMARWQPCPDSLDAWMAAAKDIGETSAKGGNHPFLMDMLTAVYTELERQYKAMNTGKEGEQEQCG